MTARRLVPARSAWAGTLAYSRAVVHGQQVWVSGTLPVDAQGELVGGDDAYRQARQVLALIVSALDEAGSSAAQVVRLRIHLRDYGDLAAIARAEWEVFEHIRPACSVVQMSFNNPAYRVQMEADAVLDTAPTESTRPETPA